jgi:hypothetical protein
MNERDFHPTQPIRHFVNARALVAAPRLRAAFRRMSAGQCLHLADSDRPRRFAQLAREYCVRRFRHRAGKLPGSCSRASATSWRRRQSAPLSPRCMSAPPKCPPGRLRSGQPNSSTTAGRFRPRDPVTPNAPARGPLIREQSRGKGLCGPAARAHEARPSCQPKNLAPSRGSVGEGRLTHDRPPKTIPLGRGADLRHHPDHSRVGCRRD